MDSLHATLDDLSAIIALIKAHHERGIAHFLLRGNLASGKTTLVQAYVKAQGIDESVTSPTFSLLHRYGADIYHYDLYNKPLEELLALGFLEELQESGIHLIEWGDERLEGLLRGLGFPVAIIYITTTTGGRNYQIIT